MTDAMFLTIAEMAQRCDVTAHTLRYYEREGLLQSVARDSGGRRRYKSQDIEWMQFLLRLRQTDMPIREIKLLAELRSQGNATLDQRRKLLEKHRQELAARLTTMMDNLHALDHKIAKYRQEERR